MAETDPCKCATPSVGPTKSTAASFKFQVCDGDNLVSVPATNIADYIINVIYGDEMGDPPAEGCYTVCYDGVGNRSISPVAEASTEYLNYTFQNETVIFPDSPVDDDDNEWWGRSTTRILSLTQPPAGFVPSHVKLRIWGMTLGDGETNILRDANGNRVFFMQGYQTNDDHSSFAEVSVPVQQNESTDDYEVYLTGDFSDGFVNIKQIGYEQVCTIDANGDPVDPVGGSEPTEPEPAAVVAPLEITHLEHTYDGAGDDQTVIEWFIDDTLTSADDYDIVFDFGETIQTETVPHIVGLTSDKQRHTVDWTVLDTLKLDAMVTSSGQKGAIKTSDFGTSDATIPLAYQSTSTV